MKPYDYMTILAPLSNSDLRRIAGMGEPLGGDSSSELDGLGLDDTPGTEEIDELGLDDPEEKEAEEAPLSFESPSPAANKKTKTDPKPEEDEVLF